MSLNKIAWLLRRVYAPLVGRGLDRLLVRKGGPGGLPLVGAVYGFVHRQLARGVVLAEVQGKRMYLDLSDRGLCWPLFLRGVYEDFSTRVFKDMVRADMVVVDVGAGIGYYTLLAADLVGGKGTVYAFEPNPYNYALLVKNVEANECNNVVCLPKAISKKVGFTKLFLSSVNRGDHRIYDSRDGREYITVEVTSLDAFFEDDLRRIDVIKMDVQGAEMEVLQGMSNLLSKQSNLTILTEFWPLGLEMSGSSPTEFLRELLRHHFTVYHINEVAGQLDTLNRSHLANICEGEDHVNLLGIRCGKPSVTASL